MYLKDFDFNVESCLNTYEPYLKKNYNIYNLQ